MGVEGQNGRYGPWFQWARSPLEGKTVNREALPILSYFYGGHSKQLSFHVVTLLGPGPLRLSAWSSLHSNSFTPSFFSSAFPGFFSYFFEDDQFFLVWCVPQTFFCFCDSHNPSEDQFLKMCWSPICQISLVGLWKSPWSKERKKKGTRTFIKNFYCPWHCTEWSFCVYYLIWF